MFSTNLSTIRKMSSSPAIFANTKQDFASSGSQKASLAVGLESGFCLGSNNLAKSFGNCQELNDEENFDLGENSKVKKTSAKTKKQVKAKELESSRKLEQSKEAEESKRFEQSKGFGQSKGFEQSKEAVTAKEQEKTNIASSLKLERNSIQNEKDSYEKSNNQAQSSNSTQIFEIANALLADIALSKRNIAFIETAFAEECANLRLLAEKRASQDKNQLAELEERLQNIVQENRTELFGTKKTLNLSFGSIAFRELTKLVPIEGWSWDGVLACLENNGMHNFIRQKREVDKLALKTLPKNTLLHLGCASQKCENFSYQTINNFLR